MASVQHPPPMFTASPASMHPNHPPPSSMRPPLPNKNVDSSSIEDAFVTFILACNPAVPLETDSTALREAFRTPPKSGGKSFSTFTLFELIKQLETKELRTWGELALKLGVEPPDEEKRESSQKIQQYAVRLKRWMHSMHIDAFFEYLMDRPSPYWTQIPSEHIPLLELEREGVAAEDDMALRALLPHIKPRRGRKKPEDDDSNKSPSQRPSPQPDRPGEMEPWTAQPERGSVFLFPPVPDPSKLNASGPSWSNDLAQTPMTAYPHPHSAITPSTRASFWADEPKSALTPSKRLQGKRHGAKAVSSAWRRGGIGGTGKTRGRPPINRGLNQDGPFSAFPAGSDVPSFKLPSPTPEHITSAPTSNNNSFTSPAPNAPPAPPAQSSNPIPAPVPAPAVPTPPLVSPQQQTQSPIQPSPVDSIHSRPAKRSRLSLQVPERVGGQVRLATPPLPEPSSSTTQPPPPPPVVMINGQQTNSPSSLATPHQHQPQDPHTFMSQYNTPALYPPSHPPSHPHPHPHTHFSQQQEQTIPSVSFPFSTSSSSSTNIAALNSFFVGSLLRAKWFDLSGNQIPPCSAEEAWSFAEKVVATLKAAAPNKEAFLINLAALAGGSMLMSEDSLKMHKLGFSTTTEKTTRTRYKCEWKLRYGDVEGEFSMEEEIETTRETERREKDKDEGEKNDKQVDWEKRYKELESVLRKKEDEMARLKGKIFEGLRGRDDERRV
ncbi:ARS-binding protein 2 [Podospora fimiseda]|uniref:ARS-binding protein 2 n=1 Tax=Podospora fimiseda TaxID=252190 RepID=A0AAN7BNA3_9PEZI|nr:ARS-binding protein 2 [Podospora fimiseda]